MDKNARGEGTVFAPVIAWITSAIAAALGDGSMNMFNERGSLATT
jgi:hypothetical protein